MNELEYLAGCVYPPVDAAHSAALQRRCTAVLIDQASAVVRRAASRWSTEGAPVEPSLGLQVVAGLLALRELSEDTRIAVVLHPTFRYWLQAMRRTSRGDDPQHELEFGRAFASLLWTELVLNDRLSGDWTVWTDAEGGLRCPSRKRFLEFGPEWAERPVRVQVSGETVSFVLDDGETVELSTKALSCEPREVDDLTAGSSVRIGVAPLVAGGRIEVCAREPWLRAAYTGTNQRTTGVTFFGTKDDLYIREPVSEAYEESLVHLREIWPAQYADLMVFTNVIVPMVQTGDMHRAFTVSSRQGAMFVDLIDPEAMVENLIHENAHIKLRQIQLLDPLLIDPFNEDKRFTVPWRPDPRPLPGIFEGLWVFAHVAEYRYRRLLSCGTSEEQTKLTKLLGDLEGAQTILSTHAEMTDIGKLFLRQMSEWILALSQQVGGNRVTVGSQSGV